jgi:hypothetical protein
MVLITKLMHKVDTFEWMSTQKPNNMEAIKNQYIVRWLPVPLLPVLQGDYARKHKCY